MVGQQFGGLVAEDTGPFLRVKDLLGVLGGEGSSKGVEVILKLLSVLRGMLGRAQRDKLT
ncbi:MAG: hypothetical protein CL912_13015 [Deltaproteobacteria bacterium]|nr:hypothetical protein [Deltaproteobacteria bacterium]